MVKTVEGNRMSLSPLAYADSLRIGTIDFVSPDEIKVLIDIEAPMVWRSIPVHRVRSRASTAMY